LSDELGSDRLQVVAVALDDDAADVEPFVEGITFPVLLDRDHLLSELYAISNVPTVVWIDEEGRIARPNGVAFGTDVFIDFTGVAAEHHMDEIRAWVTDGIVPIDVDQAGDAVGDLSEDELRARLLFRLAAHARRTDRSEDATRLFAEAGELAPLDFTIQRAAMPLRGVDPFGAEFFSLYGAWEEAGSPYHGLPPTTGANDE
jgi:hypothetical protein